MDVRKTARLTIPPESLAPSVVLDVDPYTGIQSIAVCAECGWAVDDEGLWPDRDVHNPKQVGQHCWRCGRRWFYRVRESSIRALAEHGRSWGETAPKTPEAEVRQLPRVLPSPEAPPGQAVQQQPSFPLVPLTGGNRGEPRVMDLMREKMDTLAEDMLRPFEEGLKLRPDHANMTDDKLLRFYTSQARLSERLMDRVIGTPIQRQHTLHADATRVLGDQVSLRAVDEAIVSLLQGRMIEVQAPGEVVEGDVEEAEIIE